MWPSAMPISNPGMLPFPTRAHSSSKFKMPCFLRSPMPTRPHPHVVQAIEQLHLDAEPRHQLHCHVYVGLADQLILRVSNRGVRG